jgi:hypothetical protein
MKATRVRLRETFAKLQAQGMAQVVRVGRATRRALVERQEPTPAHEIASMPACRPPPCVPFRHGQPSYAAAVRPICSACSVHFARRMKRERAGGALGANAHPPPVNVFPTNLQKPGRLMDASLTTIRCRLIDSESTQSLGAALPLGMRFTAAQFPAAPHILASALS